MWMFALCICAIEKQWGMGAFGLLFLRGTFVSAKVGYSQSWSGPWSCYITPYLPSKLYFGCNITENDSGFSLSGQKPHKKSPEPGKGAFPAFTGMAQRA